jgi:PAS domain S-box-containing protein
VTDERITIVLVDDAPDVRALLRTRLQLTRQFEVVGEGASGADAIRLVRELRPDVLLLDVSMPGMDGLDALARITEGPVDTKVVMFSGFEEHGLADRARELGAADFVEKAVPIDQVAERLVAAVRGEAAPAPAGTRADPEQVLDEHLERFRAAFERAAIGMATLTLTGRIVRANIALQDMAGVGAGALVGVPYETLVDPSRRRAVGEVVRSVAAAERDTASMEHSVGERSVVSTVAVVRDPGGKPLYLFLQVQDVSERRSVQEELRRSEERFRILVEGVGDYAIFMLDPTGHIVSWNIGAERAKGYTAEEALGRHMSIFYQPEAIAANHPQHELEAAAAEGRYEEEGWRLRKDGSAFWANVVITALRDSSGELIGYAKVTRDVTERKRLLEDLEASAAERQQLLAVTAHELRTPVAVVKGFVSTLDEHWDDLEEQERRDIVASLARSGERLSRLVEDLFTAARLESGALHIRSRPFDLGELVEEVTREMGIGEVVDAPRTMVLGDRGRVHQMVANYLTNAARYGAAPVTVTLTTAGGHADLVVADAGPGVEVSVEPRLFAKFSTGPSQEGTGLGLFIVRELARAQGGDAWYEPGPDGGARFLLRLPLDGGPAPTG